MVKMLLEEEEDEEIGHSLHSLTSSPGTQLQSVSRQISIHGPDASDCKDVSSYPRIISKSVVLKKGEVKLVLMNRNSSAL